MDYYNENNSDSYKEGRSHERRGNRAQEEGEGGRYGTNERSYEEGNRDYPSSYDRPQPTHRRQGEGESDSYDTNERSYEAGNRNHSYSDDRPQATHYGQEESAGDRYNTSERTYGAGQNNDYPSSDDRPRVTHHTNTGGERLHGRENENAESGGFLDRALKSAAEDVLSKAEAYLPESVRGIEGGLKNALRPQFEAAAAAAAPHLRKAEGDLEELSESGYVERKDRY